MTLLKNAGWTTISDTSSRGNWHECFEPSGLRHTKNPLAHVPAMVGGVL
ncbi:MAG: hypothetical protein ABJO09_11480 [Hyphomicrobiales bacterium]